MVVLPYQTSASDSEPGYSAWGKYTYQPTQSGGLLTLNFTFSNFAKHGPSSQTNFSTNVYSISPTEVNVSLNGELQNWTRVSATENRWEHNDAVNNNTSIIILDSQGSFMFSAYGDSYTKIIDVPKTTISVDGDFSDWSQATRLNLYWTDGDCGGTPGREIQEVYIAQDDNYVYLRMKLNGPPDPTFRYKFGEFPHIRITPPPNPSMMVASSDCSGTIPNPLIVFNGDEFESRFDKCTVVDDWDNDELSVWSDQDSISICRHSSSLPILNFDVSMCND
jgi:hypothetical protein